MRDGVEGGPVDRLAEEFLARVRRGENPSVDGFSRRHPEFAAELKRILPTMVAMERLAAEEPALPSRIGPYRVLREIGRGGMGAVYLAEDDRLGRRVALKVLGPEFAHFLLYQQRFVREAAAAARLDHPGICTVYDAGTADGVDFIAMRFVEGRNLAALLEEARQAGALQLPGPPDPATANRRPPRIEEAMRAVLLVERAARALHAAHEAGLVHRDVKPGNLMVTPGGEPVILDFGLVAGMGEGEERLTRSGMRLGTPAYMSPEQVAAEKARIDRRTDVYSLGVTLYECLTLRLPYEAPTVEALYRMILSTDPENPRRFNGDLPKDLAVVVETAMEKSRDRRYQTALDLAEDLRRVREHEPIRARPAGPLLRTRRWAERNPGTASASAALVLSLAAGLAVSLHLLAEARSQRNEKQAALVQKEAALRRSRVLGLVNASEAIRWKAPHRALLLAREAVRTEPTAEAQGQLHVALATSFERTRFTGHEGPLHGAAFSPDGLSVVTWSEDGTARIWGVDGKERAILRGHTDNIVQVSFSRTGDLVLTASWDGTARLFGVDGRERAVLQGGADEPCADRSYAPVRGLMSAAFSPSGTRVVTACNDGTARLFDLEGRELAAFRGHNGCVWAATFSPEGDRVATGSSDGTARVFDLEGREVAALRGHEGAVRVVAFTPDGRRLLTACEKGYPRLFDLGGAVLAEFRGGHTLPAPAVELSPSGTRVATASWDGTARLFDLEGNELAVFEGHEMRVVSVHFSPSGDLVATASWDKTARVYDASGRERAVLRGHEGSVRNAVFAPSGDRVLTACWDRRARLFDPAGCEVVDYRSHGGPVRSAVFSASGDRVMTASNDGTVRLFDPAGAERATFRLSEGRVDAARFSPAGDRILACAEPGRALLLDLEGRELATFGTEVYCVAFSPRGDRVITGHRDGSVRVFDLEGREEATVPSGRKPLRSVACSAAGELLLTASEDGLARLLDRDGKERAVFRGHRGWVTSAVFSPSGDRVLTAGEDGTARLFDLQGREVAAYMENEGCVWSAVFSKEGDRVITACEDRTVRIFEVDGRQVGMVRGHDGPVYSAVLSPSGDRALSASADGTARVWIVPADELLRLADARVLGDFSPDSLRRYADLLDR